MSDQADPVGLVFRALGFGSAVGLSVQALVAWTVRTLQQSAPAAPPELTSGPALVLLLGTFGGILAAGGATWLGTNPVRNPWRQAMFAMIGGLGSFVL